MSGVKGRSGVPSTPEQRAAKRRAGLIGAEAARRARGGGEFGGRPSDDGAPGTDDLDGAIEPERIPPKGKETPLTDEEVLSLLPGSNPYDKVVLRSRGRFTYLDGKTREQVRGVELDNDTKAAAVAVSRGELLTRDQVRARDEAHATAIKEELATVSELLQSLLPADKLLDAQKKAREWQDRVLERIADKIEGAK